MLFLVFRFGEDRYAIEATQVVEVLPLVNWKGVPGAAPGVAGIMDYRGVPVPLIDLTQMAMERPSRKWMSTRIIVVNYRDDSSGETHALGLIAEQATETMRRSEEDFTASGLTVGASPYLGAVTTGPGGTIQRIDIRNLLTESVRRQLFPAHADSR
ncbi:MAG: chemotaxis protein CheW [Acidobacteriota bacterium]